MNKDEKLLYKDLCARLPYGVNVCCFFHRDICFSEFCIIHPLTTEMLKIEEWDKVRNSHDHCWYSDIKPYLRPLNSMTDNEKTEFSSLIRETCDFDGVHLLGNEGGYVVHYSWMQKCINWLNEHYFDYHGLIEKGLALKAMEGMYKIN